MGIAWELRSSGLLHRVSLSPTFWDKLSAPTFRVKNTLKVVPIDCAETLIRNYRYRLRNSPEERSSHLLRGGSLQSLICTACLPQGCAASHPRMIHTWYRRLQVGYLLQLIMYTESVDSSQIWQCVCLAGLVLSCWCQCRQHTGLTVQGSVYSRLLHLFVNALTKFD